MADRIDYTPPNTVKAFIRDFLPGALFYSWIVGPIGSGKTTGNFMKLVYLAKLQARGPDGTRRSRCVVVRNTRPQLKDTTIKSWFTWFKEGVAGQWKATESDFILKFDDVECEVLFRPLDTDVDVARVLSLEVTFAIIDEFIEIPRAIIDALSGRLGRYPARKDGGATNFGMWGSSNPGTEDNWWHDYLHNLNDFAGERGASCQLIELYGMLRQVSAARLLNPPDGNVRYFHQPPGDSPEAENIDNLPGGREYYINNAKGKSSAWVEQFIRAVWGFSASETPVVKTFQPAIHVVRAKLAFSPFYELVIGLDPGLGGMAAVMGQEDLHGRLMVMGELTATGMGVTRFVNERLKPYLRHYFPNAQVKFAPDPAAGNKTQVDEVTIVQTIRKMFGPDSVKIETNNQLAKRLDAIESFTMRMTEMGPALMIEAERCPQVCRALGGGWRFQKMTRHDSNRPAPEKNQFSHVGDAFGYLCRYYHAQYDRTGGRGLTVGEQRRQYSPAQVPFYHVR